MKIQTFPRAIAVWLVVNALIPLANARADSMFRGDASHTGVYESSAPEHLRVRWKFHTGDTIISSPTLSGGVVYFGSADNGVYAVDATSGKQRWKFDAHGNVNSSPAVAGGDIFVVSSDGNLYAINASSGAQKWVFATEGERRFTKPGIDYINPATETMPDPWDFFLSSPVVSAGTVYFGSGDSHVYAVDAATGALKWKFKTGDVVHASPAISDGVVYVGGFDACFYALDGATGELIWKFHTEHTDTRYLMTGIPGSAAIARGIVYFGCRDAHVYAVDAKTGELRWKYAVGGSWVVSSPALYADKVYFTTSDTHEFVALNANTGSRVFALPCKVYAFSSPAIAGKYAFFGTFDGRIHSIDLERRAYTGTFETDGFKQQGPKLLDAKGEIKSAVIWTGETLDDTTLGLRGRLFSMGSFLSSPAVGNGVLYVGSVDGNLYALAE
ncbi:MAG: PQQ-binding-like beta-propeller repeat protein [Lacunisphaera sp.]